MVFGVDWCVLVLAVVAGVCIGLVTGLVENNLGQVAIPEDKYYGFPLVWRLTDPFVGEKYSYLKFFADSLFWTAVVLAVALLAKWVKDQKLVKT